MESAEELFEVLCAGERGLLVIKVWAREGREEAVRTILLVGYENGE